jgi:hypothetical protein
MSAWEATVKLAGQIGAFVVLLTGVTATLKASLDVAHFVEGKIAKRRKRKHRALLKQDLDLLVLELRDQRRTSVGAPEEMDVTDRVETARFGRREGVLIEPFWRDGRCYTRLER